MNIIVGNSYRVVKNRDSQYGGCNDIKLIEGMIVKVTNSDTNFRREGSFDITDEKGGEHCCEACNLTEINNNEEKKVMKKILKVLCVNNGFYNLSNRQFCTEGREYKVIEETDKTLTILDDGEYENEVEFRSNKWFELLYEEKENVVVKMFKIGDKVKIVNKEIMLSSIVEVNIGDTAVIEKTLGFDNEYKIIMDKDNDWWYAKAEELELIINNPKFEIIIEGDTTTVRLDDGVEGVARRYYKDEYSRGFGIVAALSKALDIDLVAEVLKVVKSYDKPTVEEIKAFADRTAFRYNKFKVGDIVTGLDDGTEWGITNINMTKGKVIQARLRFVCIEVLEHKDKSQIGYISGEIESKYFKLVETKKDPKFGIGDITISNKTTGEVIYKGKGNITSDVSFKKTILKEGVKIEPITFKKGDKVRIWEGIVVDQKYDGECQVTSDMRRYINKETIIVGEKYHNTRFELEIDGGDWSWSPSMLELVKEKELKVGDRVYYKSMNGTYAVCEINRIKGKEVWGKWSGKYFDTIEELPKTINEFEEVRKNSGKTFVQLFQVKKLILIDDTKPKNPVIRW